MASLASQLGLASRSVRPKLGRDDWTMRAYMAVIGIYLLVALALPLGFVIARSFETFRFDLEAVEFQVEQPDGTWGETQNALTLAEREGIRTEETLTAKESTRVPVATLFPDFSFQADTKYRVRDAAGRGNLMYDGNVVETDEWLELSSPEFRKVIIKPQKSGGFGNYKTYFTSPALFFSLFNSLTVAAISTVITVVLAFVFAYALTRSCMPFKGTFKMIAMVPILVPSLLPGIGLIYLFGNQGLIRELLFGESIYGPIGIVVASVFFTFPHALIIIIVALSISDARLYEAAIALRAPRWRVFWTVTLPGARYGLISAGFVVFTLVFTDFGVPKVIGGQYNVLAVDIYKQVIGQQNFQMGAVVSVVLLVPAVIAFVVDRLVQRRQVALLSARAVPYEPKPSRGFDSAMFAYCALIGFCILGILGICQFAAVAKFWPYDLSLSMKNYNFDVMDGGGWAAYGNSIRMALYTAVFGTIAIFVGAYMVEKSRGFEFGRSIFQLLAMMPMAIPGMVLGLAYIFFFNQPSNPLHFLYGTMAILVICTITHFYTVAHLTSVTALKQMDPEFEAVSASLKQPMEKVFARVTVPVCLPAILDISIYLFVNAMTTVSAVVFLYSATTPLASVAVLNMEDAGDVAPAAAMGMMIFYTNAIARLCHGGMSRYMQNRTQAWRKR